MADFDSSLPIRTEAAGDVEIKIVDATVTSQKLAVESDGSINANVTATDLDIRDLAFATDKVDVSGSSVTVSATDLDIRDLAFATDSVDVSGSSVTVSATDLDIRDLAFATDSVDVSGSSVTVSATDLDIRDLAFATDSVDVSGSSVTVSATDLDIRDLTAASDSVKAQLADSSGAYYSATNPIPVTVTSNNIGDEINNYNTGAAIASGATSNHDYTVTAGKTLLLSQIEASASGRSKIEVQVETGVGTNTWTTKWVKFGTAANPNIPLPLKSPLSVAAGVRVRIIRTNTENQALDVYSTISGQEV
jgi:hypothetical protein